MAGTTGLAARAVWDMPRRIKKITLPKKYLLFFRIERLPFLSANPVFDEFVLHFCRL
jgi:hypothetical protein